MGFNYAHEAKKWKLWKDKEDDFLKKLNVDESIITQLREYDWRLFNSERRYVNHHISTLDIFLNDVPSYDHTEIKSVTNLLDEIESEALFSYLSKIDQVTLNIILLKILGYSINDISKILRINNSAIYSRIARLKKKLKKLEICDEK